MGEKYITAMNFAEHLRKSDVSENSKVYYGRFLRRGRHEGIAILVHLLKVDEIYNILKSASRCLLVECLECPYVHYAHPLLRGRLHFVRDTAA